MTGRVLIAAAVVVYLVALTCGLWPGNTRPARAGEGEVLRPAAPATLASRTAGMPYRGVAMQVQRIDNLGDYSRVIDQIAAVGADTVEFIIDNYQENGNSVRIFIDQRSSPSAQKLGELIRYAKGK